MKYKRKIAVISDLHTGSRFALWKPFLMSDGQYILPNSAQSKLFEYWQDFCCWCADCDTVIHLADGFEGLNRKEGGGSGLMVASLDCQFEAHVQIIEGLVSGKKFCSCAGSHYHESYDTEMHRRLCSRFNGQWLGVVGNLRLTGTSVRINVAHAMGGGMVYRATGLDKQNKFALLADACGKVERPTLMLRGHNHYYQMLDTETGTVVMCPCWKIFEPSRFYMKNYHQFQPDIGGLKIIIHDDDSVQVLKRTYPLPHLADAYVDF